RKQQDIPEPAMAQVHEEVRCLRRHECDHDLVYWFYSSQLFLTPPESCGYNSLLCGSSSMVERLPSKQVTRVRFSSPANLEYERRRAIRLSTRLRSSVDRATAF